MGVSADDRIELAASFTGDGFLSIAKHLRQLQDEDLVAFHAIASLLGIDRHDAEFMARVDRTFRDQGIEDHHLAAIGWPKLIVLCDYVTSNNLPRLLEFADQMPAKELARIVGRHPAALKRMVLHLTVEQFAVFKDAILAHGGKCNDHILDQLCGKEDALVNALRAKSA